MRTEGGGTGFLHHKAHHIYALVAAKAEVLAQHG